MNIDPDIVIALVGLLGVTITQMSSTNKRYSNLSNQIDMMDQRVQQQIANIEAVTGLKIDRLASDVQKHNNVIERTYQLEQKVAILEEVIKYE